MGVDGSLGREGPSVQALWDIEQIKQLKARYFRLLDTKDWEPFAGLFTDDCVHTLPVSPGAAGPRPPQTNAEYLATLQEALGDASTVHHGLMPEITLHGETEASGVWAMSDDLEFDGEEGRPARRVRGCGHYFETYRKGEDGAWRISSKRNVRLRIESSPRQELP